MIEPERKTARRAPRMSDVAARAGVSHQTVSRVLNGYEGIRPDTRNRVELAIRELGYRRNIAARVLAAKRSQTLGVIMWDTGQVGPRSAANSLEAASREHGYALSLVTLPRVSIEALHQAADRLLEQSVEAIVLILAHEAVLSFASTFDAGIPLVLVGGHAPPAPLAVYIDQSAGAASATQHLLDLGHETVFHLAGPPDSTESHARRDAWRHTLERAGRPVPPLQEGGDWSPRSGYEVGKTLRREAELTAVFVANDQMALGLIRALNEAGLHVPNDVSIVGFDDVPEAAYFAPPLTTVRQNFHELGRRAMVAIRRTLDGEELAAPVPVPPALIVRSSSGAPNPK